MFCFQSMYTVSFNSCTLTYLADENPFFYSFSWVCGTSLLHKQMNKIWHGPVMFAVPLPAPQAGCVFKSCESIARWVCQMSFLPGEFKWLMRWLCRPNPNLKIIGVLMKCSSAINVQNNYSSSRALSLSCQPPAPSLVVVGEYPVPATSGLARKGIGVSCKWLNSANVWWAF